MKHLAYISLSTFLLASCLQEGNVLAEKKAELAEVKATLSTLMTEAKELEKEIAKLDTTVSEAAPISVELETITYKPFAHFVGVEGIVEAEEDVMVSFQSQGEITNIYVEEGDKVKKGQVLARLNAAPLQNQLAELRTRYELANTVFLKQKRLWIDKNIGSEIQYLEAKSNKEALERSIAAIKSQIAMSAVTSPINGVVDKINYKKGAFASPQQPFAQVVNLKNLYVNANLSESYLTKVQQGDTVAVDFTTLGLQMDVPIYRLGNVINPQNRSFEVQLKMRNEQNIIKPNALASLHIRDFYRENAIVLPSNIVQQDIDGAFVFVSSTKSGKTRAEKRYVETAMSNSENETLIIAGLEPGEKVVFKGYNVLTNNALITELLNTSKGLY